MNPYFDDGDVRLYCADALEALRKLPDQSVHMTCTSPPFFGLRDYGTGTWEGGDEGCDHVETSQRPSAKSTLEDHGADGRSPQLDALPGIPYRIICGKCGARRTDSQIGLESSPDEWAARLVDVFREVRRVLRDDGTLWVECGDSYNSAASNDWSNWKGGQTVNHGTRGAGVVATHKPKDLIGQPWLLAFALRADGWYLRSCIIWAKPNCMPESVTDRPTTAHSYVFLFSKRPRYFYDAEALRENAGENTHSRCNHADGFYESTVGHVTSKNARSVWTISTEPNALAICRVCDAFWQGGAPREHCGHPVVQHFAAFPRELVRRMILAGTSERGVCAECGAPWVRQLTKEANGRVRERATGGLGAEYRRETHGLGAVEGQFQEGVVYKTVGWERSCLCATPAGSVQDDLHCPRCGLSFEDDNDTTHECPPGFGPSIIPATILDPFAGSGTSLLVARQLGRHAIGIELNSHYAAMCRARMSQLSLLA